MQRKSYIYKLLAISHDRNVQNVCNYCTKMLLIFTHFLGYKIKNIKNPHFVNEAKYKMWFVSLSHNGYNDRLP